MSLRLVPEDSELEPDLPPLDPEGPPEEEIEAEIDLTEFVDSFDGEPDLEMANESASDLDVGIAVAETDEETGHEEKNELVLDIAELLAVAEEEPSADDETGPPGFEPGLDVDELPEAVGDSDESTDELLEGIVSEDLPSIDADEEGEASLEDGWSGPDEALDEPLPPDAERPWNPHPLISGERINALVVERGLVVAAGTAIHCVGRESRRLAPRGSVTSVALVGGRLLYFTAAGQLVRQELSDAPAELLDDWRRAAQAKAASAVSLELGGGGLEPGVVLARTSQGRLLYSRDRGATFSAEDLHARVLAFDARAVPAVAVVETSAGRSLIASTDGGSSWRALTLDAVAQRVVSGGEPIVAAAGEVVALADVERGVAVSADSGRTFVRVPGSAHATALAIGGVGPHVQVWAALHQETEDMTAIIAIDAATQRAELAARIAGDFPEGVRVDALAWDGAAGRLLATGGFGLFEITAPDTSA